MQEKLFPDEPAPAATHTNCARCGVRCRKAAGNPEARLLAFDGPRARWVTNPKAFWDANGVILMDQLVDAVQSVKDPDKVGKDSNVYIQLWNTVRRIWQDEELKQLRAQLAQRS
jgi:hypothetical protein